MSTKNAILAHEHLVDIGELEQVERAAMDARDGGPRFLATPALVLRLVNSYRHALDAWMTSDVEAIEATDVNADLAARLHETRCALGELVKLVSSNAPAEEMVVKVRALAQETLAADDQADEDMNTTIGLSYEELCTDVWAPDFGDDKAGRR